jgi:calcineurin-like phosphoesterase family protein
MIYFIADTHFGHDNVIKFCNRQFETIKSMNNHMIESWNKVVQPDDEIYFLGDFSFKINRKGSRYFLHQLNGKKYFIKGNHDRSENLRNFQNSGLIEWWKHYHVLSYEYKEKTYNFSLCHYPHYPVKGSDTICLHGHVHGLYEHRGTYYKYPGVLDVGVDNIGYEPISIIRVIEFMERQRQQ